MSPNVTQSDNAADLPAETICFPEGLLGFPGFVEYRLAEGPGPGLFWLVSDSDGPAFLVSDPFRHFEGYSLDLTPEQANRIDASETGAVAVLAITIPHDEEPWTANLQGPIVINAEKRLGAQLVLPGAKQGVRVPFVPTLEPLLQSA